MTDPLQDAAELAAARDKAFLDASKPYRIIRLNPDGFPDRRDAIGLQQLEAIAENFQTAFNAGVLVIELTHHQDDVDIRLEEGPIIRRPSRVTANVKVRNDEVHQMVLRFDGVVAGFEG